MKIKTGVVMDSIAEIKIYKDSTFAMLLEAQRRGHDLLYMELPDLRIEGGDAWASMRTLRVADDPQDWFQLGAVQERALADLDVVLMRKDPPFNMDYIYATYILELAELAGTLVVNRPQALRDANEKLSTAWFPQCCVPMLVSRDMDRIKAFVEAHPRAVIKPLDGMGGESIFQLNRGDPNLNVILESVSKEGSELVMVQEYITEIASGDKRILLLDGEAVDYALARIPAADDFRGNLARGGHGKAAPLSDRDRWIAAQVGPELKRRGILFAGIDVIGDYLTEVNVTSPTCIRELDQAYKLNIAGDLFDIIEVKLRQ